MLNAHRHEGHGNVRRLATALNGTEVRRNHPHDRDRHVVDLITLPTTAGSVPNRECQYLELMTPTGVAVGRSVSGRMVRPMRAATPSI